MKPVKVLYNTTICLLATICSIIKSKAGVTFCKEYRKLLRFLQIQNSNRMVCELYARAAML